MLVEDLVPTKSNYILCDNLMAARMLMSGGRYEANNIHRCFNIDKFIHQLLFAVDGLENVEFSNCPQAFSFGSIHWELILVDYIIADT